MPVDLLDRIPRTRDEVCAVRAKVMVMAGGRRVGKTSTLARWAFDRATERQEGAPRTVYVCSYLGYRWWSRIMLPLLRRLPWPKGTKIRAKYIALPSGVRVEPWTPPVAHAVGVDEAGAGPRWLFTGTPTDMNIGWAKVYSALEHGGFSPEEIARSRERLAAPLFTKEFEGKYDAG